MSAPPIYNPVIPFVNPIPGGMYPGRMVRVQGSVPPGAQRFAINFQCGPNTDPRDDIALHLNFRFVEMCVVRNHLTAMSWGVEDTAGGMPLIRGEAFEALMLCEPQSMKIALNGAHFCEFPHRIPPQRITHITVDGDVAIQFIGFEGAQPPPQSMYMAEPPSYGAYGAPPPAYGAPGYGAPQGYAGGQPPQKPDSDTVDGQPDPPSPAAEAKVNQPDQPNPVQPRQLAINTTSVEEVRQPDPEEPDPLNYEQLARMLLATHPHGPHVPSDDVSTISSNFDPDEYLTDISTIDEASGILEPTVYSRTNPIPEALSFPNRIENLEAFEILNSQLIRSGQILETLIDFQDMLNLAAHRQREAERIAREEASRNMQPEPVQDLTENKLTEWNQMNAIHSAPETGLSQNYEQISQNYGQVAKQDNPVAETSRKITSNEIKSNHAEMLTGQIESDYIDLKPAHGNVQLNDYVDDETKPGSSNKSNVAKADIKTQDDKELKVIVGPNIVNAPSSHSFISSRTNNYDKIGIDAGIEGPVITNNQLDIRDTKTDKLDLNNNHHGLLRKKNSLQQSHYQGIKIVSASNVQDQTDNIRANFSDNFENSEQNTLNLPELQKKRCNPSLVAQPDPDKPTYSQLGEPPPYVKAALECGTINLDRSDLGQSEPDRFDKRDQINDEESGVQQLTVPRPGMSPDDRSDIIQVILPDVVSQSQRPGNLNISEMAVPKLNLQGSGNSNQVSRGTEMVENEARQSTRNGTRQPKSGKWDKFKNRCSLS